MDLDDIRGASRWMDSTYGDTDANGGIQGAATFFDLRLEDVMHVAEQRAVRLILLNSGMDITTPNMRKVLRQRHEQVLTMSAMFFDGFFAGLAASKKLSTPVDEETLRRMEGLAEKKAT